MSSWNSTFTVLKVQRPISTTDESIPWLFYNRDHSVDFEMPEDGLAPNLVKAMGDDLKMYVNAYIDFDVGRVEFLMRLPEEQTPDW